MSISDVELIRFTAPWIGLGFVVAWLLGFMLDVRGAIAAFALGAIAPTLAYLPPGAETTPFDVVLGMLRRPVPLSFGGTGSSGYLIELTLDWWLGGAFGAALAIYARRQQANG